MCADASPSCPHPRKSDGFCGPFGPTELTERSTENFALMAARFGATNLVRYRIFCERYPSFPAMLTGATPEQLSSIALLFSSHTRREMFGPGNEKFIRIMHRCCEKQDDNHAHAMRFICAKAYHGCDRFLTWNPNTLEFCEIEISRGPPRSRSQSRKLVIADERDGAEGAVFRDSRVVEKMREALAIIRAPGNIRQNFVDIESWAPVEGVAHGLEEGTRVYHGRGLGVVDILEGGGGVKIRCEMAVSTCTWEMEYRKG